MTYLLLIAGTLFIRVHAVYDRATSIFLALLGLFVVSDLTNGIANYGF